MSDVEPRPGRRQRTFLETLSAAQHGSRDAHGEIVRRFYPQVRDMVHRRLQRDLRYGRPWLLSRFSTGDVVQEVFRSLLEDLGDFEGKTERAFVGYLAMMSRNRLIDAIRYHEASRRDGRLTVPEIEDLPEGDPVDPSRSASVREEAAVFRELVADLPRREQLLIRARTEDGARFRDLAEQLGYSSPAAARRAYYATQARLAVRLGLREIT